MSIVRVSHDKKNPYVMLNKNPLEDKELSWGAKGLWAYLMSRPDDWHISVAHLSTIYDGYGGGEDAIYTLLNELKKMGYCYLERKRDEKGRLGEAEYMITEFKNKVPHLDCPDLDCPDLGNPPPTNKGYILSKEDTEESSSSRASSSPKNDDASGGDDDACGASKISLSGDSIQVTQTNGKIQTTSVSDIVRVFCSKPYPTEILMQAIERLRQVSGPVNNIIKYVEEICKSIIRENERHSFNSNKKSQNTKIHHDVPVQPTKPITWAEALRRQKCQNDTLSQEKEKMHISPA